MHINEKSNLNMYQIKYVNKPFTVQIQLNRFFFLKKTLDQNQVFENL